MRPKEVQPTVTEIFEDTEYWNKRKLRYLGDDIYFDQEIRTGVCYVCKRNGRAQKSIRTALHHLKYDHDDKLAWTIEVCNSCHWQIDPRNREAIERRTGRHIPYSYGKFYVNKKQKKKDEEREKIDWYKRYCFNFAGEYSPIKEYIPNQEFYDKVVAAIKADSPSSQWKKTTFKKETMSDVSSRYC